jgi:hypothetical protein
MDPHVSPRPSHRIREIHIDANAILRCGARHEFLRCIHGRGAAHAASKATASKEDDVKELVLEEVLRIAGGVPVSAALDELTYRAPEESAGDPIDYARLLDKDLRPSEPT